MFHTLLTFFTLFSFYAVIEYCIENTCLHGGKCTNDDSGYTCDCRGTGYEGELCESSELLFE